MSKPPKPKPSRARGVKMVASERRAQIISVSRQLFSHKGFRGTTIREIAKASGISEAMIFRHFASKHDLYTAIIDQRIQDVGEPFTEDAMRARDDERVFGDIALYFLQKTSEDPTMLRLLYFSALEGHELSDIFFSNHEYKRVMRLVGYIQLRINEGAFSTLDPILVARAFMGMVYTYVTAEHLFNASGYYPNVTRDEVIHNFLSVFLNGVRHRPPRNTCD